MSQDSEDDSSEGPTTDDDVLEDRNKIEAQPFSPTTPLSPKTSPLPISTPSLWQQTGASSSAAIAWVTYGSYSGEIAVDEYECP